MQYVFNLMVVFKGEVGLIVEIMGDDVVDNLLQLIEFVEEINGEEFVDN